MRAGLRSLLPVLLSLHGCGGAVPLRPAEPERAPGSPLDSSSVVLHDSVLETDLVFDMEGSVAKLESSMSAEFDRTAGREREPGLESEADSAPARADVSREDAPDSKAEAIAGDQADPAAEQPMQAADTWRQLRSGVEVRSLVRRDEVRFALEGEVLIVEADLRIGAVARLAPRRPHGRVQLRSCGCDGEAWCEGDSNPPRLATVRWTTHLRLRPDWHLAPTTSAEIVNAEACDLGHAADGEPVDPMAFVLESIEETAKEAAQALNLAIADADGVKRKITKIWQRLSEPAPVVTDTQRVLALRPQSISIGHLGARDKRVVIPLHIGLRPVLLAAGTELEMPPLPEAANAELPEPGLRIAAPMQIPLEQASAHMGASLLGLRFSKRPARHLKIKSVRVYGSPEAAVVKLQMIGSAEGSLFLRGRLAFDAANRTVVIEDLDFTRDSMAALRQLYDAMELPNLKVRRAHWVDAKEIRDVVRRAARWPVEKHATALRERIAEAVRRPLTSKTKLVPVLDETLFSNLIMDGEAIRLLLVHAGQLDIRFRSNGERSTTPGAPVLIHPRLEPPTQEAEPQVEGAAAAH